VSVPLYQAKAEFFKTLGHPARIRILELLSERDHAVHELLDKIAVEPSSLSQQLAVLRKSSMVVSRREGGEVIYSVSAPEVRDLLLAARRILTGIITLDPVDATTSGAAGRAMTPARGRRPRSHSA
jgi:ArsR family transcriptional regulator